MGREEHCKQIALACVGSACSISATLGFPLLMAYVLSQSTLLSLQVALQGNCLKRALGCMYFPGLSHSCSGSWVLHKSTDSWACVLCPSQVPAAQVTRCLVSALSSGSVHLITSPIPAAWFPGCTVSGVPCVSSGELISGCDPLGRCQPYRIPGRLG